MFTGLFTFFLFLSCWSYWLYYCYAFGTLVNACLWLCWIKGVTCTVCVSVCESELYFERQHSSNERSAVDLCDVSSLHHDDRLQLFYRIHRHHHLTSTFRVETPETKTHTHWDTQTHTRSHTFILLLLSGLTSFWCHSQNELQTSPQWA